MGLVVKMVEPQTTDKWKFLKVLPGLLLLALAIWAYYLGWNKWMSFEELRNYQHELLQMIKENFVTSSLLYIIAFIVLTSLSLPVALFMVVLGGYLFPQPYATVYATIGATIGALIVFIAARMLFREFFRARAGTRLKDIEVGFHRNSTLYLLSLRLVPIVPYWLVNIAAAIFNVPFWTYAWTTFIGIIPAMIVFTLFGDGIEMIIESDKTVPIYEAWLRYTLSITMIFLGALLLYSVYKKLTKSQ